MTISEFSFNFNDLEIKQEDLAPLLGFEDGNIPDPFPESIEQAIGLASELCNIKTGYVLFDEISVDAGRNTINIKNQVFNPPKIVITRLKDASSVAVFTATAGAEITDISKKEIENGDPLLGFILDVIGSVTVERATEKMQQKLYEIVSLNEIGISDRFSPGYCEWNVGEQQKLFSLLPAGFCGIILSDSSLMTPIKSVSGFIGIGKSLKQKGYQCHWCTDKNCIYGKIKRMKTI